MRIKIREDWGSGDKYLHDVELKRDYRRIIAGVSWPTDQRPGAIVVLSEDKAVDPAFLKRHLRVLHEHTAERVEALMGMMDFLQDEFGAMTFYGDVGLLAKARLSSHNLNLDIKRKPRLQVWRPPATPGKEGLHARVLILLDRVKGEKTLHFGAGSRIPAVLGPMLAPGWKDEDGQPLALATLAAVTAAELSQPMGYVSDKYNKVPSSMGY